MPAWPGLMSDLGQSRRVLLLHAASGYSPTLTAEAEVPDWRPWATIGCLITMCRPSNCSDDPSGTRAIDVGRGGPALG
jgi:hypothetical protein